MKIAFLDRDGTISKEYPKEGWRHRTEPEMIEGSIEGMKKFIQMGYKIIIVTNQFFIREGIITLDEYQTFTNHLLHILNQNGIDVLHIYYCPRIIVTV